VLSDALGLRAALLVLLPAMLLGALVLARVGPAAVRRDAGRMRAELAGEVAEPDLQAERA
jgi:hypothetical protein